MSDAQVANGYVWFVSKNSPADHRGYILFGLWNEKPDVQNNTWHIDYSREMHNPWDSLIYYARFNLKVPGGGYSPLDTVAKIEAHLMNLTQDRLVADSLLLYQDFDPDQYKIFELSFWKHPENANDSLDYKIYWYKKTDLYIDYVEVYDCYYDTLVNHKPMYQNRIKSEIAPFENQYHGTSLFRWYLKDEPEYKYYKANREISDLLDSLGYAPGIQAVGHEYIPKRFADEIQPHEICWDDYIIATWVVPHLLQYQLNQLTFRLGQVAAAAREHNVEWWYVAQTYRESDSLARYPHNSELRATVYLSLAYGAKGMGYFRYSSAPWWTPETPIGQSGLMWWNNLISDWVPVETYSNPNPYSNRPETLLTEVVRINFWLDSLGTTLRSLDWIDACVDSSYNNNDLLGCGAGYIDSIRSHNSADEPHWVQVGFFENQTSDTSYFMLVNRECLVTEGANYDVFVNKSGGRYRIRDMYADTIVGIVNGTGDHFTVYLGPGEGKLFRLEPIPKIKNVPADYATIQSAINATWDGDTVLVAPGTYYENINFQRKAITVASDFIFDHNPATIQATVINGSAHLSSVVSFGSGESSTSVLKGLTITGGTGTSWSGQGRKVWLGGGIYCTYSSPSITNNLIIDNHIPHYSGLGYQWGGGIGCQGGSSPIISNNLILSNSCANDSLGGGIYFAGGRPVIVNNTLSGNTGGGITFSTTDYADSFVISNNIIANSTSGWGIRSEVVGPNTNGISYNDVWNNAFGSFMGCPSGVGDTTWGTNANGTPCDSFHNIIRDPMFVNPDADYHLQRGSVCVDAGDNNAIYMPNLDFDGKPRIAGKHVDMGAYENAGFICGDANGDGQITVSDVVYLINYLFKGGPPPECPPQPYLSCGDANCDGKVTVSDVIYLINYLFKGGPPPGC
ncbi:MAG TPA: choice-of-anchor Q domain-containing protein [candidate division Zixibacteria bacterium]